MDYNMQLTQAAGALVAEVLGGKLSFKAYPIEYGNTVVWEFGGYPLWPSGRPGKVFVCFPRNTFTMRGSSMKMQSLNQAQCKFFQGDLHNAFAHPHVYPSGTPCWSQGRYDRVPGFLQVVVETLTLHSTTETSVKKGLCATTLMGVGEEALQAARRQNQVVLRTLHPLPVVQDSVQLAQYLSRRWPATLDQILLHKGRS